jgi:hypothetical protein
LFKQRLQVDLRFLVNSQFSTLILSALNDRRQFFLLYFYVCLALQVKPCSSLAVSSRLSVNVPSE